MTKVAQAAMYMEGERRFELYMRGEGEKGRTVEGAHFKLPHASIRLVKDKLGPHLCAHGPQGFFPLKHRRTLLDGQLRLLVYLVDVVECDLCVGVEPLPHGRLLLVHVAADLPRLNRDDAVEVESGHVHRPEPPDLPNPLPHHCEVENLLQALSRIGMYHGLELVAGRLKRVTEGGEPWP